MNNNSYKAKDSTKIDREYVEELIYENIKLADNNIMLGFDNEWLRKRVEQLEKANRRLTQSALARVKAEQIIIIMKKEAFRNDNYIL